MKLNNRVARMERALGRRTDDRIPVVCVDASGKRGIAQYSNASTVDYRHDLWMVADETDK
jgi:hypothetical protein